MSSSILRRFISKKIGRRSGPRKSFCSDAVSELVRQSSPCMMLPPSFPKEGVMRYKVAYFLSPTRFDKVRFINRGGKAEADLMQDESTKCVGSSHGWLALINLRSRNMFLLNPVFGRLVELPPYRGRPFTDEEMVPQRYVKVILSHSPNDKDCRAVMIFSYLGKLAWCRPGLDRGWTPVGRNWTGTLDCDSDDHKFNIYEDFVYSDARKTFLGSVRSLSNAFRTEELEYRDHKKMDLVKTVRAPPYVRCQDKFCWQSFLVAEEETGQLFLVRRYDNLIRRILTNMVEYKVYTIDERYGSVGLCSTLDDLVMFVGINHSFAVKASKYPQFKPNSIYYSGNWHRNDRRIDLFDYNTKAFTCFGINRSKKWPSNSRLLWFTPTMDN